MKHHTTDEQLRAAARDRVIRAAERVLAQAYRCATRQEMMESQLRVRQSVVHEIGRRQS